MNSETIYNDYVVVDASAAVRKRPLAVVKRLARRVFRSIFQHYWERHAVRELSSLSSHMLKDIGMERHDIHRVAADLAKERARQWER